MSDGHDDGNGMGRGLYIAPLNGASLLAAWLAAVVEDGPGLAELAADAGVDVAALKAVADGQAPEGDVLTRLADYGGVPVGCLQALAEAGGPGRVSARSLAVALRLEALPERVRGDFCTVVERQLAAVEGHVRQFYVR